eukprot:gene15912-22046_t
MERYKVIKRIGVGTYGSAYLICWKTNPDMQLVLKKIKQDEASEKEKLQAETEVKVLAQLDHPLVLGYVDHFMYKSHLCIVTEYCEGGDLYQLLKERKTPLLEAQVLELLVQILSAVHYVHSQNILHRDLKTQNIFLTKDGNVKLGDFGISRSLNSTVDLASTLIGTPYYMSPEVMSSMPYDFKSDMWSLGCCLYETMTLKHAFDADDMSSLVLKIMRGEHLPIPTGFSPELRDLDYVARAKDKLLRMQHEKSHNSIRRREHMKVEPSGDSCDLDRELAMAKERLQMIQQERETFSNIGSPGLANIPRAPSGRYRRSDDGSVVLAAPIAGRRATQSNINSSSEDPIPHHNGNKNNPADALAAGIAVQSVERRQVGLGQGGGRGYQPRAHASHVTGSSSENSPTQSMQKVENDMSLLNLSSLDPKARKEAKRQEEIRRREAELLNARKVYFEERKQAEAKKWDLYHGGVRTSTNSLKASGQLSGSRDIMGNRNSRETESEQVGGPQPQRQPSINQKYSRHSYNGAQSNSLSLLDSSEDEFEEDMKKRMHPKAPAALPRPRPPVSDPAAQQEFEAELSAAPAVAGGGYGGGGNQPMLRTFEAGAGYEERVTALRNYCIANLGPPLFEMIYNYMRKRSAAGSGDDTYFRKELQSRLGQARMQYVHLIDQLLYFEDNNAPPPRAGY